MQFNISKESTFVPDICSIKSTSTEYQVFTFHRGNNRSPVVTRINVNGEVIDMEVDTGAAISIIDEGTYQKYFKCKALRLRID